MTIEENRVTDAKDADYCDIAYNPVDDVYLLVSEVEKGMMVMYLDGTGKKLSGPTLISKHERVRKPVVVFHELLGEFIVVYMNDYAFSEIDDQLFVQTVAGKP